MMIIEIYIKRTVFGNKLAMRRKLWTCAQIQGIYLVVMGVTRVFSENCLMRAVRRVTILT